MKTNRLSMRVFAFALTTCLFLASCGGGTSKPPVSAATDLAAATSAAPGADAGEMKDEAKTSMMIALDREPVSLDPPDSNVAVKRSLEGAIYDTLLRFDGALIPQPYLAESYQRLDDLTWEFKLRKGVTFHNGEQLKASDVVFSFKRMHDIASSQAEVAAFDVNGYSAPDDVTFILKTKEPYAFTEQQLCSPAMSVLCEKAVNEMGATEHSRKPVGSGPYKFDSWENGTSITLIRNDAYWGEKPPMEKLVFRVITEAATRTIELEAGGIDINLALVNTDAERIQNNPSTALLRVPSTTMRYVAFNTQKAPLNDVKVRQALYSATDVKALAEVVYGAPATATQSQSLVPSFFPGANTDLTMFGMDLEKSKALLAEAGYTADKPLTVEFMYLAGATNDMLVQMLQEMWKKVNVTLVLKPMESAALTAALNKGEHQICSAGTSMGLNDAGEGLNKFFNGKNRNTSAARSNLDIPQINEALNKITTVFDTTERAKLVYDIQPLIYEQAPLIPICHTDNLVGTGAKVRGFQAPVTAIFDFTTVYLVK